MKKPAVSVVIPNWNGQKFLRVVLPTLAKQTYRDFETIVVDNDSTDGSVAYLKKHWPKVQVLALPKNTGFAGAVNRGIKVAGGRYVALLNNDLEVDRRWIAEMAAVLDRHQKAGSAACKMMNYYRRGTIDEVGNQTSWYGVSAPRGRGEKDQGLFGKEEEIFGASAGAAMYRRRALKKVGLFDEDFFAYLEDTDWAFRAQLAGFECWYAPKAVVYHMIGGTSKKLGRLSLRMSTRNNCFVIMKNYPAIEILRNFHKLCFGQGKTLLGAIKEGWLGTLFLAWGQATLMTPKMLWKRRRIQRRRTASTRRLRSVVLPYFPLKSKVLGRSK